MTSPEEKIVFKKQLKAALITLLNERIQHSLDAIDQAQDSANSESKSSMGDKYETSRAMGQLDADMNAKQLKEAESELSALKLIPVDVIYESVVPGSVVQFDKTILFIACGLGTIKVNGKEVITLSVRSPLYLELKQKAARQTFTFQNRERIIDSVF